MSTLELIGRAIIASLTWGSVAISCPVLPDLPEVDFLSPLDSIELMFDGIDCIREVLASAREIVAGLEPRQVAARDAVTLVELFAELERIAAAGRTVAGRRLEETRAWFGGGYPSLSKWMAARAQTTERSAIETLETGRRLENLPATRAAFMSGGLSTQQALQITAAATANPSAEASLLESAQKDTMNALRLQCEQVIAAASTDLDEDERRHRSRYLRLTPELGMMRIEGLVTSDAGARLKSVVDVRAKALQEQARAAGSRERREAYAADALVGLAEDSTPGPRAVVNVVVDYAAIQRGRVANGERCEVPGIGPISVAAAQRLAEGAIIKAVLMDENDVRAVAAIGRKIPARVRAAVVARDTVCVIHGCDETRDLELHHIEPVAKGGKSSVKNLARPCKFHHMLITHHGWRLVGRPGAWEFLPPERRTAPGERAPPVRMSLGTRLS